MSSQWRDTETETAPESAPSTSFGLGLAWRRKWLVALAVVVGLIVGVVMWVQQKPTYKSTATVLVIKKRPNAIPVSPVEATLEDYDDYLGTHIVLLKSPVILERAARRPELTSLLSMGGRPVTADLLNASLTVSRDRPKDTVYNFGNNQVLRLSISGWPEDESPIVLKAIIDSYKDFLDTTYQDSSGEAVRLIVEARVLLEKDLKNKTDQYRDFRQKTPLLWKGKDGVSLYQEILAAAQSKRAALQMRRADIEGELKAVKSAMKAKRSPEELAAIVAAFASRKEGQKAQAELLLPLVLQEQELLDLYGAEHPKIKLIRKQIDMTREILGRPRPGSTQTQSVISEDLPPNTIDAHVHSLELELDALTQAEQSVTELFNREQKQAREMTDDALQDELMRADISRTQQLYDSILKRVQEFNLVKGLGGFEARMISPPTMVGDGLTSLFRFLSIATLMGLVAGMGLVYVAEITDKRFRTPEEIRSSLNVPVVGHIPSFQRLRATPAHLPAATGRAYDLALCSHYRPHSLEAEAYRAVRTALYFSTRGKEHKVIQITSPNKADGKTTLSTNLAVCIAQSGKKVLLIDADFRRPRIHKIFALSNQTGLASLINGTSVLSETIQDSGIAGLAILPSGRNVANPAELLTSPQFEELLAKIRGDYDFVLIDTPPVLAVTDACVVAPRVDSVLLTIHISKNARPQTERAKELLDGLQANVLGVVVNAVGHRAGYGSYYGYSYYQGNNEYCSNAAPEDFHIAQQA
jgi:capsular exopolysaccharide synthesis family protein